MASDSIPEEWRAIEGWPYEVSSIGRVRRSERGHYYEAGRLLCSERTRAGQFRVHLCDGTKRRKRVFVHRLVCEAWHGPAPEGCLIVAHNDGNPGNNRPENLRWASHSQNIADAIRHGRTLRGERNPEAKLTQGKVRRIVDLHAKGMTQTALAKKFGVTQAAIWWILSGRNWNHITSRAA